MIYIRCQEKSKKNFTKSKTKTTKSPYNYTNIIMDSIFNIKNYEKVEFNVKDIMKRKNIARNKLSVLTGATDNVINRYYNNTITRLDLDVLARICFVLDCNISDIIEYKK